MEEHVMRVSNNPLSYHNQGGIRVVFGKKNDIYLAWNTSTMEGCEYTHIVTSWKYAEEIDSPIFNNHKIKMTLAEVCKELGKDIEIVE